MVVGGEDLPARTNPNPKKVHLMALIQWCNGFIIFSNTLSKKAEGSMMRKFLRDFSVQVLEEDFNEIWIEATVGIIPTMATAFFELRTIESNKSWTQVTKTQKSTIL